MNFRIGPRFSAALFISTAFAGQTVSARPAELPKLEASNEGKAFLDFYNKYLAAMKNIPKDSSKPLPYVNLRAALDSIQDAAGALRTVASQRTNVREKDITCWRLFDVTKDKASIGGETHTLLEWSEVIDKKYNELLAYTFRDCGSMTTILRNDWDRSTNAWGPSQVVLGPWGWNDSFCKKAPPIAAGFEAMGDKIIPICGEHPLIGKAWKGKLSFGTGPGFEKVSKTRQELNFYCYGTYEIKLSDFQNNYRVYGEQSQAVVPRASYRPGVDLRWWGAKEEVLESQCPESAPPKKTDYKNFEDQQKSGKKPEYRPSKA